MGKATRVVRVASEALIAPVATQSRTSARTEMAATEEAAIQ